LSSKGIKKRKPGTGSTGPQFGPKLGRKLKGGMKEVHMKKEWTKLVFFSHPPTQIGLHKSFTPQFGIFITCTPPPLLFIFFTKSSVERIKSFQNL
jgi:hypothetical protein